MPHTARIGQRLPSVRLAGVKTDGSLKLVSLEKKLAGRRVIIVGLPGAFTPICTGQHIPALVEKADMLKSAGIDEIIVAAPNSPWVVQAWAEQTDPKKKLTFLSDGNLEFARQTGLVTHSIDYFLGECSKRFTMILDRAVVEKLFVEDRIDVVKCTTPDLLLI